MRDLGPVEEDAVLEFTAVSQNAVVPDDHIFPDVGPVPYPAVRPDPGRAGNVSPGLHHRPFPDVNLVGNKGPSHQLRVDRGLQPEFQVGFNLAQRVPDIFPGLEERQMLGLLQSR